MAVFGVYPDRPAVEKAIENLRGAGFRGTEVSVLYPGAEGAEGGVPGWLSGGGTLAIPGLGAFFAAGPVVAALACAAGTPEGIRGALAGMGLPEPEATRCDGRIRDGGILLLVHCESSDWIGRVRDILRRTGAGGIAAAGEQRADVPSAGKPKPRVHGAGRSRSAADPDLDSEGG